MKITLLILLLAFPFLYSSVQAQTGVKIGFKAGYNLATQYGITPADISYEVDSDSRNGFTGGMMLYFPVTDDFGVQQEFLFTQKGSDQLVSMTIPPISTTSQYKLNYFEMPVVMRYTFVHIGNLGVYGSTGFALSLLLDGEYDVNGLIDMGPVQVPIEDSGDMDGLDEFDYSFVYGLGVRFPLLNQDCFFDYRQTIGWNTLMMPTSEGGEPAPLRNQSYSFALGIYF